MYRWLVIGLVIFSAAADEVSEPVEGAAADEQAEKFARNAKRLHEQGDLKGALLSYDQAISLAQTNADYYCERGKLKLDLGKHSHAIVDFRIAVAFNPELSQAWLQLGIANYILEKYRAALKPLDRSVSLNGKNARGWFWYGLACQKMADDDRAIRFLRRAVRFDPKFTSAWYHLGRSHAMRGEPLTAAEKFGKAIKLDPEDAGLYSTRGLSYLQHALISTDRNAFLGAAANNFRKALRLNPNFIDASVNFALLYFVKGNSGAMNTRLKQALKKAEGARAATVRFRAWALMTAAGKSRKAAKFLAGVPRNLSGRAGIIRAFLTGTLSETEFKARAKNVQQQSETWFYIGMKYLAAGNRKAAAASLERCTARGGAFGALTAVVALSRLKK